ncbi:hypothetical protein FCV24_13010 [Clostridium botulinum]|nr:hypothetical protein [Clostridium botulinum]NFM74726.1 hypothetical protein [Clostridium botulinum]NFP79347.1 hypothetical protein [Clostridium botulinum]NFP93594.1 hypothetical protein [Clostridium botulinum]NFS34965.1 hypothetical protein [Clostridium botulinum]
MTYKNLNTSYVIVQRVNYNAGYKEVPLFKYISCYCSTKHFVSFHSYHSNLNTSHVNVQQISK